jgi:TRAP-type C4-dicarboxylate transport system permease small subunit
MMPSAIHRPAVSSSDRYTDGLNRLDRALGVFVRAGRWLALAVTLLLFLQWPLRDWIQAYSREANDLAQVLFAWYVALAVTAATRARAHLAVDAMAARRSARWRDRIGRAAAGLVLLPASLALLAVSAAPAYRSVRVLEGFPDTFNPGYFVLKLALLVLTAGVLVQALVDAFKSPDEAA